MSSILLLLVVSLEVTADSFHIGAKPVQGCLFIQGCSLVFLLLEHHHVSQLLFVLGTGLLEFVT